MWGAEFKAKAVGGKTQTQASLASHWTMPLFLPKGIRRISMDAFTTFFFLFRAPPIAYGSSQARGQTGTAAASLHLSHNGSKLHLWLILQLTAPLDPSLTYWARPGIKPASSQTLCWVLNPLSPNMNCHFKWEEIYFSHLSGGLGTHRNFFPPCPEPALSWSWKKWAQTQKLSQKSQQEWGADGRCSYISICKLARVKKAGKAAILSFVVIIVI